MCSCSIQFNYCNCSDKRNSRIPIKLEMKPMALFAQFILPTTISNPPLDWKPFAIASFKASS